MSVRRFFFLTRRGLPLVLTCIGFACGCSPGMAQERLWTPASGLPVGSEEEGYLRLLQVAGLTRRYPWSIRGFLPSQVCDLLPADSVDHPWSDRFSDGGDGEVPGFQWGVVTPSARAIYNTTYPFGSNDGVLWAGKGLSGVVEGGLWAEWGPLHLRVAPEAFWTQNAAFDLAENGEEGDGAFRDPRYPEFIDHPQRLAEGGYGRVELGNSTLALDLPVVGLGISTASQMWGPTLEHPVLLGDNAGGFPHAFLQTSDPVGIGIGDVHARVTLGRLDQSEFSPVVEGETARFMSGLVATFRPRGLPGLELGAERFVDGIWPDGGVGIGEVGRLFESGVSTDRETNIRGENQLAGVFLRWVLPSAGVEVFGEFIREDFGRDVRHLLVEPDDLLARTVGLRWLVRTGAEEMISVQGEFVSAEAHHSERGDRVARFGVHPYARYTHGGVRQGHTLNGQLLASPAAFGGSAVTLGADRYTPDGRTGIRFFRELRLDWLPSTGNREGSNLADVQYGVRLTHVRRRNARELTLQVIPTLNLNRNLVRDNDTFNLSVLVGYRGLGW